MTLTGILTTDQHRALDNIRAAAERLWARPLHRYYTDHSVAHSERIAALLDGLTAGMMHTDKRLAPVEAFVLLAAATLHDIGMQDERFAGGDLEETRAQHHQQPAEMIYRVFEDPGSAFALPLGDDPGLVEAIALVAKGHRQVDLGAPEYEPFPLGGETLRPRLLAALLRFADELDIDYRRVDLEQMKLLDLPLDSQLHWWKCHYVGGVTIVDEYIRVSYRFPRDRPDYEGLLIPLIENEIRAKHTALEPIFRQHAVKVAIGQPQVRLMRLVQPMPPEVEALAREPLAGSYEPPPDSDRVPPVPSKDGAKAMPSAKPEQAYQHPIDPDDPPIAAIRRLLTASFPPQTLRRFCLARPTFRSVVDSFGPGHGLNDMVDRVIEYCEKGLLWDELLAGVKEISPRTVDRFVSGRSQRDRASGAAMPDVPPETAGQAGAGSVFDQRGQIVGTQINIAGDVHGPLPRIPMPDTPSPTADTAALRARLGRLDAVEIESLCLDHFPDVYDKFGRGQRRDEMINLLLDHCRRNPEDAARLAALLR